MTSYNQYEIRVKEGMSLKILAKIEEHLKFQCKISKSVTLTYMSCHVVGAE